MQNTVEFGVTTAVFTVVVFACKVDLPKIQNLKVLKEEVEGVRKTATKHNVDLAEEMLEWLHDFEVGCILP